MKGLISFAAAMAALVGASAAEAHDFFLMPDSFRPAAGSIRIHATVGSNFPKAENTVAADRVERLIAIGVGSPQVRAVGATATALDLDVTGAKPGMLLTAVRTKARDVDYAEDRIPLILGEYRVSPKAAAAVEKLTRPRRQLLPRPRQELALPPRRVCLSTGLPVTVDRSRPVDRMDKALRRIPGVRSLSAQVDRLKRQRPV